MWEGLTPPLGIYPGTRWEGTNSDSSLLRKDQLILNILSYGKKKENKHIGLDLTDKWACLF